MNNVWLFTRIEALKEETRTYWDKRNRKLGLIDYLSIAKDEGLVKDTDIYQYSFNLRGALCCQCINEGGDPFILIVEPAGTL